MTKLLLGGFMKDKRFQLSIGFSLFVILLIVVFGDRLNSIELLPDQGASWYYWKLPTKEFIPRLTAWVGYLLHQIFIWYGIYQLKNTKSDKIKWQNRLLIGNGFFILMHFIQTHLWYEGLAQDVPVFSSQGSVIIMLVLILILENDRRGILFGQKIKGFKTIKQFIKSYHGYFIAWALAYTFWYHPLVNTSGHLVGFFYMFLLFIQTSLAYTKLHTSKLWIFFLEVLVLFHGTIVAIGQGNNMWPMFGFGFAFIAVFTQIYSLNIKTIYRTLIQILYLVGAIIVYLGGIAEKSGDMIHQVTWIPIIEYALVFIILFVGEGLLKMNKQFRKV
jgi:hypothetical protein